MPADIADRHVSILRSEIDTASAMMSLVRYTGQGELVRKYKEVALRSYLSAMDLIAITPLTPKEEQDIGGQLSPIKQWLEAERLLGK